LTTLAPARPDTTESQSQESLKCPERRKDGTACEGRASAKTGLCIGHTPGSMEARAKGGRNSARAVRAEKRLPPPLKRVGLLLHLALEEVYLGTLNPTVGTAMASIASALIKVHTADSLEERLQSLEERAEGSL